MTVHRLEHIPGFNIDRVATAAGDDPDVLRLENLDTDIPPPIAAMKATRAAIGADDAISCAIPRRVADRHVRFVFSNDLVERLRLLGSRVRRALDDAAAT